MSHGNGKLSSCTRHHYMQVQARMACQSMHYFIDCCALQMCALDAQALLLAFTAATMATPLQTMSRHRPPSAVALWPNFVLMGMMTFLFYCCDCTIIVFLCTRPWFSGGNGTSKEVTPHSISCLCIYRGVYGSGLATMHALSTTATYLASLLLESSHDDCFRLQSNTPPPRPHSNGLNQY